MEKILILIGMGYLVMFCTGVVAGKMIERSKQDIYEVDEEGNIKKFNEDKEK